MKVLLPFLSLFTLVSSFENIFLQPKNPAQVEFKKIFPSEDVDFCDCNFGFSVPKCQDYQLDNLVNMKLLLI